ncbi:hypothetical protein FRB94_003016 [Tulasnella sp. JGI-2019a]|nr:hypothetical protein FRB94_003016 [Tulasnella sp. JGI-2019a]KAG9010558.1 hypothetical protein FRB93_003826 [Tulasnella sp. JGI-2019a]
MRKHAKHQKHCYLEFELPCFPPAHATWDRLSFPTYTLHLFDHPPPDPPIHLRSVPLSCHAVLETGEDCWSSRGTTIALDILSIVADLIAPPGMKAAIGVASQTIYDH